jgi:hypothetical protein
VICLVSHHGNAQSRSGANSSSIRGLEGGFGIHSATIKSDIAELNNLSWMAEGGRILFVSGNSTLMTKCGVGFYYSASNVPQTIDLFYSELSVNFYPISLMTARSIRINPYLVAGAFYNLYKFGGTYLGENAEPRNFSTVDESYLARMNQINLHLGAGIEYRLIDERQFLNLFAEGTWAAPILSGTQAAAFEQTTTAKNVQAHIGVRFGLTRYR